MTNQDWLFLLDVARDDGAGLERFEGLVKGAQKDLLDAMDTAPITADTRAWHKETKKVRKLLRTRAEDLEMFRKLCNRVRETLAQRVVNPIRALPNPQPSITALSGTGDGRIIDITRELFPALYNDLRQFGLEQVAADTKM